MLISDVWWKQVSHWVNFNLLNQTQVKYLHKPPQNIVERLNTQQIFDLLNSTIYICIC